MARDRGTVPLARRPQRRDGPLTLPDLRIKPFDVVHGRHPRLSNLPNPAPLPRSGFGENGGLLPNLSNGTTLTGAAGPAGPGSVAGLSRQRSPSPGAWAPGAWAP